MAEAAPITPKNGEYIGASSVLIVAWFVGSRRSSRSRVYLQIARRSVARDRRTQSNLHVTHGAKLVAHCQIWPTGLPEYSGAGHVMSDERSTRWKVAAVAACRISPFMIGCELEPPTNRASRRIPSRLTLGSPIGCVQRASLLRISYSVFASAWHTFSARFSVQCGLFRLNSVTAEYSANVFSDPTIFDDICLMIYIVWYIL